MSHIDGPNARPTQQRHPQHQGQEQEQYLTAGWANTEQSNHPTASYASALSNTVSEQLSQQQLQLQQEFYYPHTMHFPQQQQLTPDTLQCPPIQQQFLPPPPPQIPPPMRPGSALSFLSTDNNDAPNSSNPRHVSMKKWIDAALHSLDNTADDAANNNNRKLSSGSYLTCALKIAHSLADQLCKFEQEEKEKEGLGTAQAQSHRPSQGLQWSDLVTICLNNSEGEGSSDHNKSDEKNYHKCDALNNIDEDEKKNEINDDGFEGRFRPVEDDTSSLNDDGKNQALEAPKDIDDLISDLLPEIFLGGQDDYFDDSFRSDPEMLLGTETCHQEGGNNEGVPPVVDYLNISSAELRMEKQHAHTSSIRQEDKRMYIYYLGLLFFELFSGGKSPIAEEKIVTDPPVDNWSDQPSDIAPAMSILDAIGDDDELFGGMDMGLDESDHSGGDDFNSNKKSRNFSHVDGETTSRKKCIRAPEASSVSVEPLKLFGLPIALCDLIGNMIDCSRGDFSGDETYSCMSDVQKDLKLMLESPGVYLRDLDLDLVCNVGLQMDDRTATWYGRDAEFASLKETYLRSIFDQCDVAIICGQQGVGKSSLAQEFAQYAKLGDEEINMKGCIFLSGKFDKLKQSQPFSPIASAFNKYCEWLSLSDEKNSIAEKVSGALKLALGQEVYALAKAIPNLSNIIGTEPDMDESDGVEDAQKRLRYLLSQFAEVISYSNDAPLVLFIDNLQWADSASIALIKQILLVLGSSSRGNNSQFFFLGCCNEMEKGHDLWNMLHSVNDFGVNTTKIELDFLDEEIVNLMISKKLNMLPRLTRPLTDIVYHKTKGNPFFVGQLMIELSKDGLLRPSLSRCRWVWEEDKIQERELPDDVVSFLTASLNRLPSEVLSALFTLSCFGSCTDHSLVELENELGLSLSDPLGRAVAEGFLNKKDGKYHFVDERVRESAYNLMKPEERCLTHFNYGLALCSVVARDADDALFLIAVGQINLGGPKAVVDDDEGFRVANHNLMAGKKAMDMSDFYSAYWFFDYGLSYLKKGHWETHYDLSLALYDGAAECAFIIGEHASLSILSEQIMHFAKCIEDKLNIFDVTIRILIRRSNLSAAVECGIDALLNLGEDFPEEVTPDVIIHFMEETKEMLDGMSDEELINYKLKTDSNKIMAMKFLAKISEALYMIRPSDQPIVVLKMVQLSVMHGMSSTSPLAFVLYGSFLASTGNIREGYRYTRIAKALLEKVCSRSVAGEVIAYSTQLMAYVEPVQSAIEFHIEGEKAAMKSGRTAYALLNAFLYESCSYWSGKKLLSVKSQLDRTISLTKQNNHVLLLVQWMPLYGLLLKMIGHSNEKPSNPEADAGFDSMFDIEKLGRDLRAENSFQSKPHYFNKMYTAFMFRNYDGMKSAAEQYSKFKIGTCIIVFISSIQLFYEGLVSFWIGRKEEDKTWIEKGKNSCRAMESLVDSSSKWNFENKATLLQAEEQFCAGNLEVAEKLYDSAVSSAKEHKFIHEEALALELAGLFYLKTGRTKRSIPYLSQAVEKYREWEACAKALSLEKYLEEEKLWPEEYYALL